MFRDDRAMTGLEASIVLIAFVVVASVFAYVVIDSGIFLSQKSKAIVNGAVDQVSSALELNGMVRGNPQPVISEHGDPLITINFSLKAAAFSNPVDLSRTVVRLIIDRNVNNSIFFPRQGETVSWTRSRENPPDMLLETGEIVDLCLRDLDIPPSTKFTLEVLPPAGMSLSMTFTTPSHYDSVITLGR